MTALAIIRVRGDSARPLDSEIQLQKAVVNPRAVAREWQRFADCSVVKMVQPVVLLGGEVQKALTQPRQNTMVDTYPLASIPNLSSDDICP
jgi:hypothetical protein